jgi:branched-subunit amino acid transport protein
MGGRFPPFTISCLKNIPSSTTIALIYPKIMIKKINNYKGI